jgi:hypothetical protein
MRIEIKSVQQSKVIQIILNFIEIRSLVFRVQTSGGRDCPACFYIMHTSHKYLQTPLKFLVFYKHGVLYAHYFVSACVRL